MGRYVYSVGTINLSSISRLFAALIGCSPMTLIYGIAPDHGFKLEEGISCGQNKRQHFDIYYFEVKQIRAPVIVFFMEEAGGAEIGKSIALSIKR